MDAQRTPCLPKAIDEMDFLLKTQRNQLFKAVEDTGLNPADFILTLWSGEWAGFTENLQVPTVMYVPNGEYIFAIEARAHTSAGRIALSAEIASGLFTNIPEGRSNERDFKSTAGPAPREPSGGVDGVDRVGGACIQGVKGCPI